MIEKKQKKQLNISIGIAAYNKEGSIANVLGDILRQNTGSDIISEIIIFCEKLFGCLGSIVFPSYFKLSNIVEEYSFLELYDSYWDKKFSSHNGLYKNSEGKKVVIKSLSSRFKNLKYKQISNEIAALQLLNKLIYKSSGIKIPHVIQHNRDFNKIIEVREYIEGVPLKEFNGIIVMDAVKKCIRFLKELSVSINQSDIDNLPRRSARFLAWTLPFYFLCSTIIDPKKIRQYFRLCTLFYKLNSFSGQKYVFAHRDLHSGNIIINGSELSIIDFEVSALAEPETDLAIAAMRYSGELGADLIIKLINDLTEEGSSRKNFFRLTIFYAMQVLTIESTNRKFYKETQDYLTMLEKNIIPVLFKEKNIII